MIFFNIAMQFLLEKRDMISGGLASQKLLHEFWNLLIYQGIYHEKRYQYEMPALTALKLLAAQRTPSTRPILITIIMSRDVATFHGFDRQLE